MPRPRQQPSQPGGTAATRVDCTHCKDGGSWISRAVVRPSTCLKYRFDHDIDDLGKVIIGAPSARRLEGKEAFPNCAVTDYCKCANCTTVGMSSSVPYRSSGRHCPLDNENTLKGLQKWLTPAPPRGCPPRGCCGLFHLEDTGDTDDAADADPGAADADPGAADAAAGDGAGAGAGDAVQSPNNRFPTRSITLVARQLKAAMYCDFGFVEVTENFEFALEKGGSYLGCRFVLPIPGNSAMLCAEATVGELKVEAICRTDPDLVCNEPGSFCFAMDIGDHQGGESCFVEVLYITLLDSFDTAVEYEHTALWMPGPSHAATDMGALATFHLSGPTAKPSYSMRYHIHVVSKQGILQLQSKQLIPEFTRVLVPGGGSMGSRGGASPCAMLVQHSEKVWQRVKSVRLRVLLDDFTPWEGQCMMEVQPSGHGPRAVSLVKLIPGQEMMGQIAKDPPVDYWLLFDHSDSMLCSKKDEYARLAASTFIGDILTDHLARGDMLQVAGFSSSMDAIYGSPVPLPVPLPHVNRRMDAIERFDPYWKQNIFEWLETFEKPEGENDTDFKKVLEDMYAVDLARGYHRKVVFITDGKDDEHAVDTEELVMKKTAEMRKTSGGLTSLFCIRLCDEKVVVSRDNIWKELLAEAPRMLEDERSNGLLQRISDLTGGWFMPIEADDGNEVIRQCGNMKDIVLKDGIMMLPRLVVKSKACRVVKIHEQLPELVLPLKPIYVTVTFSGGNVSDKDSVCINGRIIGPALKIVKKEGRPDDLLYPRGVDPDPPLLFLGPPFFASPPEEDVRSKMNEYYQRTLYPGAISGGGGDQKAPKPLGLQPRSTVASMHAMSVISLLRDSKTRELCQSDHLCQGCDLCQSYNLPCGRLSCGWEGVESRGGAQLAVKVPDTKMTPTPKPTEVQPTPTVARQRWQSAVALLQQRSEMANHQDEGKSENNTTTRQHDGEDEDESEDKDEDRESLGVWLLALFNAHRLQKSVESSPWTADLLMHGLIDGPQRQEQEPQEEGGHVDGDKPPMRQLPLLPLLFETNPPSTVPLKTRYSAESGCCILASTKAIEGAELAWKQKPHGVTDDQWATSFILAQLRLHHGHLQALWDGMAVAAWRHLDAYWSKAACDAGVTIGECVLHAGRLLQAGAPITPLAECGVPLEELLKLDLVLKERMLNSKIKKAVADKVLEIFHPINDTDEGGGGEETAAVSDEVEEEDDMAGLEFTGNDELNDMELKDCRDQANADYLKISIRDVVSKLVADEIRNGIKARTKKLWSHTETANREHEEGTSGKDPSEEEDEDMRLGYSGCYVDCLPKGVAGAPQLFVCSSWEAPFSELISSLCTYFGTTVDAPQRAQSTPLIFIDFLAMPLMPSQAQQHPLTGGQLEELEGVICNCSEVLLLHDSEAKLLSDPMCLFNISATARCQKLVQMSQPKGRQSRPSSARMPRGSSSSSMDSMQMMLAGTGGMNLLDSQSPHVTYSPIRRSSLGEVGPGDVAGTGAGAGASAGTGRGTGSPYSPRIPFRPKSFNNPSLMPPRSSARRNSSPRPDDPTRSSAGATSAALLDAGADPISSLRRSTISAPWSETAEPSMRLAKQQQQQQRGSQLWQQGAMPSSPTARFSTGMQLPTRTYSAGGTTPSPHHARSSYMTATQAQRSPVSGPVLRCLRPPLQKRPTEEGSEAQNWGQEEGQSLRGDAVAACQRLMCGAVYGRDGVGVLLARKMQSAWGGAVQDMMAAVANAFSLPEPVFRLQ